MKKLKVYSLRHSKINFKNVIKKVVVLFTVFFSLSLFFLNSKFLLTDISNKFLNAKITQKDLYVLSKNIPNSTKIIWPVKEVVDLSYKSLQKYNFTYGKVKQTDWESIPEWLKIQFPLHINDYINKYKNITLQKAWDYFSNPEELNYFTFMRRVIRTIWTASYDFKNIWIRWSWTHAWVDIISAVWTPIYSITTGLVVEVKYGKKGFWNYLWVLYKVNWKYYEVFYWHLHKILVSVGQIVWKWQKIALMWDSGNSTAPHLHFQVNKVFVLEDIVSGKIMMWWYHNLAWVKAYTVDPILFVENNLDEKFYWNTELQTDSLEKVVNIETKTNIKSSSSKIDKVNLIADIQKELHNSIKKQKIVPKAYIKSVKLSLIDNKVQVWHWFTIKLEVSTWNGQIAIKPSNSNLAYSPDLITNPDKSTYIINVLALKPGLTKLIISDGKSIRQYDITIYSNKKEIFGLQTNVSKFYLLTWTLVKVYPIDKFGRKLNIPLKGNFKIYFTTWGNIYSWINIQSNWELVFKLTWKILWKSKLVIEGKNFVLRKNIVTDLAKDYSYDKKYALDLATLIDLWIVKGTNWYLMPKNKLSRRALLIIIWRGILKVNYKKARSDMLNWIKNHWRFFKDVDWKAYADPYIFIAWKKWIIKGENWYSLANTYVSKAELLTILTRLFKISVVEDPLNVWKDLKNWKLKAIADTAKKYNLYPFTNFNYFNPGEKVSRLIAFETFYRYLTFKQPVDNHLVAPSIPSNPKSQLEQAMKDIFNF